MFCQTMRNLKLKATLKTILSDWPDKPNQGECQFLAVDLVLSLNIGLFVFFFNRKGTYLTERKREAGNLQNLLASPKSSPFFICNFLLSKRNCFSAFDCFCMIYVKNPSEQCSPLPAPKSVAFIVL